jgi:protochlorophyllide reductase
LGHFYLNHLLLPKVNTDGGRIVVTASGVHDPESPGGAQGRTATLGNLEGFERDGRNFEMVNDEPYDGDKAYKDSKVSFSPTKSIFLFISKAQLTHRILLG